MEKIKNIRNMDDTRIVCVYDINNMTYKEIIDDNYKIKKDVGFYVKVTSDIVGVMESTRGPIFFFNNRLYYLKESNYQVKHTNLNDTTGNFKLIIDEIVKEDITYTKPLYTDYDQWSSEKDVDFFQWICQSQENVTSKDRFHNFYTRQ